MKRIFLLAMILTISIASFAQDDKESRKILPTESQVIWTGKKVTGEHTGTIQIKEGALQFNKKGELTGGEFTLDMTSIQCTDLEGGSKGKLEGHLASEDFFGIETHPTANMIITDAQKGEGDMYNLSGELTIKGIVQTVSFAAEVGMYHAMADIVIDRTKFEIKYKSKSFFEDLGDKVIYDDFDLKVSLTY